MTKDILRPFVPPSLYHLQESLAAGFSGDGAAGVNAELNYPTGAAVGASGNVLIADTLNNRIRKVTSKTGIIS